MMTLFEAMDVLTRWAYSNVRSSWLYKCSSVRHEIELVMDGVAIYLPVSNSREDVFEMAARWAMDDMQRSKP